MKKLLWICAIFIPSMSYAALNKEDVEQSMPEFSGIWDSSIVVKGVNVYPQKGVFDMEGIAYKQPVHQVKKSRQYIVWDNNQKFKAPIINKLRVSSGLAPVSKHDNEFVRLCRFDMTSSDYYEMSATQANAISEVFVDFSPVDNCLLGGDTSEYWLKRYSMFYDAYGNHRGVY